MALRAFGAVVDAQLAIGELGPRLAGGLGFGAAALRLRDGTAGWDEQQRRAS